MSDFVKDTNVPANDCISRQAAIVALDMLSQEHRYKIPGEVETYSQYNEAWQDALDRAEGAILNLPSAQSEPKTGRWIKNEDRCGWHCSECMTNDIFAYDWDSETGEYEFQDFYCPHCGAKMEEGENK